MTQRILTAICALLSLVGCAATEPDVFEQIEELLGTEVTLTGYLKYGFENRNLYPTDDWERDWDKDRCLPIGIALDDEENSSIARKLDGDLVEVSGTIQTLVSENEVNASFCKKVGLRVSDLRSVNGH